MIHSTFEHFEVAACPRCDTPLSKVAAAARSTTVMMQCNELEYAPRDLIHQANVAQ